MIEGRKILIGITGSIAAYKSIYLVRLLIKAGAEVKVIMTPSARDFVSVLTLSTLSRNKVLVDLFEEGSWANHVELGRWADLMIIAPLSCNTMAKMANGQCDNLLLAAWLSATCPVVVAPAMDEDMWKHPATRDNVGKLQKFGNTVIPAETGELASGLYGEGRMAEPEHILDFISSRFFLSQPLKGKKALVTAGPTYEPIDPVRFIGNQSSGKMGIAIARELHERGADVTLVLGPSQLPIQSNGIEVERVITADQMYQACDRYFDKADITIMAAAVADYSPREAAPEKIKKKDATLQLELLKTRDILKSMGERKRDDQVLVGFALETNNEIEHSREKLKSKNADLIVLNSLAETGAGFGHDTNKVTILERNGGEYEFPLKTKNEVAKDIVDTIIRLYYAK
jgi:phosphopantothenoylcysteine decarboxylase / phosphopantothenate---cysteine ligase